MEDTKCSNCEIPVKQVAGKRTRLFCSDTCRQIAYQKRRKVSNSTPLEEMITIPIMEYNELISCKMKHSAITKDFTDTTGLILPNPIFNGKEIEKRIDFLENSKANTNDYALETTFKWEEPSLINKKSERIKELEKELDNIPKTITGLAKKAYIFDRKKELEKSILKKLKVSVLISY